MLTTAVVTALVTPPHALHPRPAPGGRPRLAPAGRARMAVTERAALWSFDGAGAEAALEAWERIDDVIMGGVSSSRLVLDGAAGCASFEGKLRSEGGGFCGQRIKLLAEPLDLSSAEGIYLDLEPADDDADARVWKVALRCAQDRGEVVYQAALPVASLPKGGRQQVQLPFSSFQLVRGPRLVPGAPPLTAAMTNSTFQLSFVVSKFQVSSTGEPLPSFKEGAFAMRLFSVGTYGGPPSLVVPTARALTDAEQATAAPLPMRVLRPVLGLLFGERVRRRRAASLLLKARGTSALARARLGFGWRAARKGGALGAAGTTAALGASSFAAFMLSLPIRLLFKAFFGGIKAYKAAARRLGGGGGAAVAA